MLTRAPNLSLLAALALLASWRCRLVAAILAVAFALSLVIVTAAKADPYLTMDAARNFALNHVWYDECKQWTNCYAGPDLAGNTYRVTDRKVSVHVNRYWRGLGQCTGRVWVRIKDDGSLTVYDESLWVC